MNSCPSYFCVLILLLLTPFGLNAQKKGDEDRLEKVKEDIAFIDEVEESEEPDKVLHAEPLYIDLIRDLGARKGEKEWNIGFGILDRDENDEIETLVEYEFAPVNRLGLEIELPFSFFPNNSEMSSRLNSLQLAAQYSFYVSTVKSISLAIGYLHEFELVSFDQYGDDSLYKGNVFNPFFIAAKRLGNNFHTLLYTGPVIERLFNTGESDTSMEINANFHYMISGTTNFIGVEFNMEAEEEEFTMIMRPQMRVEISDHMLVGLVSGIPLAGENNGLSMFFRLIYEPD